MHKLGDLKLTDDHQDTEVICPICKGGVIASSIVRLQIYGIILREQFNPTDLVPIKGDSHFQEPILRFNSTKFPLT